MITLFGKNMCESCFAENTKDPCEKCGFSSADYQQDATALPIGKKLQERYLIGRVIGKGGFGITYAAFDTKLERRVAIKEYYPYGLALRTPGTTMVSAPDADGGGVFDKGAEKFYDEARLVAKFSDNQNIVSIHDFFYENNTVYYIMEYLQGQSMKKYVEKHGVVSAEQAVYIAQEVSNALVSSHSANVLHRDIAPDNIILCNNGKVKLIDFGAARQVISEGSQSLSVILKQGFAPLEQYQKKGKQGPWTDIYALGATIYYLTTGDLLDDPMTRMDDDDEFSSNIHNINEELGNVIKKATMLRPADRYKNIFEFREDLNNIGLGSVPLTISYDAPTKIEEAAPVGATMPAKATPSVGETMPAKEASPVGATMPAKEASPIGATMPAKEASSIGATMPVKEASPIGATMPVKEASPIGATMPAKEASTIGATMPAKEASSIGATMPVKEASPIGATMPMKEVSPIGATMPVKEPLPPQKSGIFVESDDDDEKSYQSAAEVAEQLHRKKMPFIIGLGICVAAIIIYMCVYFSTHVKIGNSWYSCSDGYVSVSDEKITGLSKLAAEASVKEIEFCGCTFSDPSVLEELTKLKNLDKLSIYDSDLKDISGLSGLTSLTYLDLHNNDISDISALEELTKLTYLNLSFNRVSNIEALENMTKLESLYLYNGEETNFGNIVNLSPLKNLTKLKILSLKYKGRSYMLNADEIEDFFNKNIKTEQKSSAETDTEKQKQDTPAVTEKQSAEANTEKNKQDKPAVTEKQPAVTEKQPAVTEKQPAVTEKQPAVTEKQPAVTESAKSQIVTEEYTDGSVYVGEIKNGKRNGYGTMKYSGGDVYEGNWKDGQKSGQGTYKSGKGWVYVGEWKNDKSNGYGTITFSDGDVYEGEWKDDKFSGKGTYTSVEGWVYEGNWKDDQRNGYGKITFSDGDVYEGEWKDSMFNGKGTYKFSDGDVYVGEFKNDVKSGYGTYTSVEGWVYEGNWKDDQRNGYGKITYSDGDVYEGEWKNDEINGQGTYTNSDGDVFVGEWVDGESISGAWSEDLRGSLDGEEWDEYY